jgi:uroporphyrinogen decarboxylase
MSDYGVSNKVIVDVITLDSEACAPCQYMVESVKAVTPEFEGIVEWREHKIKYREALVFMTSLMVKNIPTICIDGQITFVSRIPRRDELIAAIQRRIYEKMRIKIQRRRAELIVLGPDTEDRRKLESNIRQATTELGSDVDMVMLTDDAEIRSYGITPEQTPAVVLARYDIKAVKAAPDVAIIKEWIKSAV